MSRKECSPTPPVMRCWKKLYRRLLCYSNHYCEDYYCYNPPVLLQRAYLSVLFTAFLAYYDYYYLYYR